MIMRMYISDDGVGHLINEVLHIEYPPELGLEWFDKHLKGRPVAFFHVAKDGDTYHIASEVDDCTHEDGTVEGFLEE